MFRNFVNFTNKYKIIRGMISYGTLWPCGSLIEQTLIEKKTFQTYDWMKCLRLYPTDLLPNRWLIGPVLLFFLCRFSFFGFFFMGPTIYVWIRLAGVMWPRTDIKSSLCKAITEQTAYDPMAISSFLFFMTLMEGNTYAEARREVKTLELVFRFFV